ncbi:hypothetical protein 19_00019 [Pseudomonas phage Epa19]|nr:hypothetical protein 19_00019 [Pseudomonas phage Epa19]
MTDTTKKTGMEAFFTRSIANEGIELPLYAPTGEKTEHWLRVRGIDSDEFRTAEANSKRDAFQIASVEDLAERTRLIAESQRKLVASLVVGWSFEQECTLENVMAFFREAPQIQEAVDRTASRRALFFAGRSSSSPLSPSTSSDSI